MTKPEELSKSVPKEQLAAFRLGWAAGYRRGFEAGVVAVADKKTEKTDA